MRQGLAFLVLVVLAGCNGVGSASDPKSTFDKFSRLLVQNLQPAFDRNYESSVDHSRYKRCVIGSEAAVDIRKTDSLISPFLATTEVHYSYTVYNELTQEWFEWPGKIIITCAFQDSRWVPKTYNRYRYNETRKQMVADEVTYPVGGSPIPDHEDPWFNNSIKDAAEAAVNAMR